MAQGTFTVTGNHGVLTVDAASGEVVALIPFNASTAYAGITRFDVAEWRAYWEADLTGTQLDILDVGYWDGGEYVAAEEDWRGEVREAREARRAVRGSPVLRAA